ncbi:hypothetical protein PGTUg99_020345 [Puccinia graminis f. sp. tritici]|uniref:Uncharacterized protein n=1 Tax=Puccinia graminis f. sp. tritici TaxID=56615 RepID=A0A5B0RV11_PUCGR|nr:hypothetical protein PGTUg99_020345 [Puccinia graminis f. sp. tritici]
MESNQSNSDLVMRDYNCAALKNDLLMNGNPRLSESSEGSIGPWQWRAAAQISFGSGQSNPSGRRSSDDIQPEVRKLGSDFDICVVLDHREPGSVPHPRPATGTRRRQCYLDRRPS